MITCHLMGGLGNQIFQIFATISYAIKTRNAFKFTNATSLGGNGCTLRNTYWDTFFHKLKHFTTDEFPKMVMIKEHDFMYNNLPFFTDNDRNLLLYGYFQSYKYFESNYGTICRMIGLENMKRELITKLNYDAIFLRNVISMHFRIGDYKPIQDTHPIMNKEYYRDSIQYILSKYREIPTELNIMYFCEEDDIEDVQEIISYLSTYFPGLHFVRGENHLEDWEQLLLMSCCHHNIIANSSFSWWAAYFNGWENKIVCYPSVWFGPSAPHDTKDLCPPSWKKITVCLD